MINEYCLKVLEKVIDYNERNRFVFHENGVFLGFKRELDELEKYEMVYTEKKSKKILFVSVLPNGVNYFIQVKKKEVKNKELLEKMEKIGIEL